MTDGYIKPQHKSHPALRFVKQYQTEIMIGAVVILTVKNHGLRKDLRHLADISKEHLEATNRLQSALNLTIDAVDVLRRDVMDLDLDAEALYQRTDDLRDWFGGLEREFLELKPQ